MKIRLLLSSALVLIGAVGALALPALAAEDASRVLVAELQNDVNPVTSDYVVEQIERAEEEGFEAFVLELDTPGGLDSAMRDVIQKMLQADVPIVVYVAPEGARAASAGMFITLAADVAAMAPQTNIGSSTPVAAGGGEIPEDLKRKVVNDAVAYARALAEEHDRNADWAERAVREAANVEARRALELDVVEYVAPSLEELLADVDGLRVAGETLQTADAEVVRVEMSTWQRILDTVIDPNLIVLLMSLGVLGITVELWNPGLIFPGTVGAVSLILGLFGLQVLPISWAGLLLMLLALALFVADLFVQSHGALTVAGAIAFVFGALLLFDPAGELYEVSLWVAVSVAATFVLFFAVVLAKVVALRRRPPTTGYEGLVGCQGLARDRLEPEGGGWISVQGERWRARVEGEAVERGEAVVVTGADGLTLTVRPVAGLTEADQARLGQPVTRPVP